MYKSMIGNAWWDDEEKTAIERKKKAWLDYVAYLQRMIV